MAKRQHLLLTARHGAGDLGFAFGQFGKDRVDLGQLCAGLGAQQGACGAQVVIDRQRGQDAVAFGDGGDAGTADGLGRGFQRFAVQRDGAAADRQHPGKRQHQFGFARTIGTDDGGDLTGFDRQADTRDEGAVAVGDGEVSDGKGHGVMHSSVPR